MDTQKEEKSDDAAAAAFASASGDNFPSESSITAMMNEFQQWSKEQCKKSSSREGQDNEHVQRMAVMDELVKSHTYAVEMKRAAVSASSWLKSIGRGQKGGNNYANAFLPTETVDGAGTATAPIPKPSSVGQTSGESEANQNGTKSSDMMELLTLKAMLHSTQLELNETKRANTNLNEELSNCRAEIGRLKSVSRNEVSTTKYHALFCKWLSMGSSRGTHWFYFCFNIECQSIDTGRFTRH
jgi:hypothetical protein